MLPIPFLLQYFWPADTVWAQRKSAPYGCVRVLVVTGQLQSLHIWASH